MQRMKVLLTDKCDFIMRIACKIKVQPASKVNLWKCLKERWEISLKVAKNKLPKKMEELQMTLMPVMKGSGFLRPNLL